MARKGRTAVKVVRIQENSPARRLQVARAQGLTSFVGRQMELAALHAVLAQAGAGHGQVVAVVGEAGVGKVPCSAGSCSNWRATQGQTSAKGSGRVTTRLISTA